MKVQLIFVSLVSCFDLSAWIAIRAVQDDACGGLVGPGTDMKAF